LFSIIMDVACFSVIDFKRCCISYTQIITVCVIVDLLDLLFTFYFIVSFFVSYTKTYHPFRIKMDGSMCINSFC
jgi:hypothetical protein